MKRFLFRSSARFVYKRARKMEGTWIRHWFSYWIGYLHSLYAIDTSFYTIFFKNVLFFVLAICFAFLVPINSPISF